MLHYKGYGYVGFGAEKITEEGDQGTGGTTIKEDIAAGKETLEEKVKAGRATKAEIEQYMSESKKTVEEVAAMSTEAAASVKQNWAELQKYGQQLQNFWNSITGGGGGGSPTASTGGGGTSPPPTGGTGAIRYYGGACRTYDQAKEEAARQGTPDWAFANVWNYAQECKGGQPPGTAAPGTARPMTPDSYVSDADLISTGDIEAAKRAVATGAAKGVSGEYQSSGYQQGNEWTYIPMPKTSGAGKAAAAVFGLGLAYLLFK